MLAPLAADDPRSVGPYRLHGRLGEGGMGVVYQGFAPDDTPVAIKFPHRDVAVDPEFRARFRQEVTAARRVRGTFVAEVLDADVDAPRPWMATAYVDGVSLADAVRRRGRLESTALTSLAIGLAEALVVIHAAGVVHRDLKPGNIIMAWDGPKVIDFGIARVADATVNTKTGFSIGTVAWMAPEQLTGERAGSAADIFAWGTCVAFAATGRHPFAAETPAAAIARTIGGEPDLYGIPAPLTGVIARALAKSPAERLTAADVVAALSGQQIDGVTESEQIATRIVRGRDAGSPGSPFGPPQASRPAPTRVDQPWAGWQTPPQPQAAGPWPPPQVAQPPAGELRSAQPPPPPPAASDWRRLLAPPEAPQQGWFGRSVPMPAPLLIALLVAGLLAVIPAALRAPAIVSGWDLWDLFDQFGIAFLALPAALVALVAGNRWGAWRDFAGGCVVGLSVTALAELGLIREFETDRSPLAAGWWMIMLGALAALIIVLGWRGFTAGWGSGRWMTFTLLLVGLGVVVFAEARPNWKALPASEQPSLIGAAVVAGVLILATLLVPSGGASFFIALVAAGLCVFEMFVSGLQIYLVASFAVLIGLVALGLLCDRRSDRFFLFAARVGTAVALLQLSVPPLAQSGTVIDLGESKFDLQDVHLFAFGAIALLALLGARARGPLPPMAPWQPPPPGPAPYGVGGRPYR